MAAKERALRMYVSFRLHGRVSRVLLACFEPMKPGRFRCTVAAPRRPSRQRTRPVGRRTRSVSVFTPGNSPPACRLHCKAHESPGKAIEVIYDAREMPRPVSHPARFVWLSLLAFIVGVTTAPAPAWANKDRARDLYRRGMAKYVLDKWDAAITDFESGFQEEPLPAFLFNIAQAHRKAGRPHEAISYFKKYLDLAPDSQDRLTVETAIADMEREMRAAAPPPVIGPEKVVTPVPAVALAPVPPPAAKRPLWPIWVGVAGGVLVVGAVTATAVVLGQPESALPLWNLR